SSKVRFLHRTKHATCPPAYLSTVNRIDYQRLEPYVSNSPILRANMGEISVQYGPYYRAK
ncbi:MAG: hypothetical protein ACFNVH_06570, partial [Segatella maculosa]